jgi:hypothetical protein
VQEFWQVLRQPGGALQKTRLSSSLAGATPRRGFHEVVRSWKNWGNPERSWKNLENLGKSCWSPCVLNFWLRESILMLQSRTYLLCGSRFLLPPRRRRFDLSVNGRSIPERYHTQTPGLWCEHGATVTRAVWSTLW